jgi:hypothetical protein
MALPAAGDEQKIVSGTEWQLRTARSIVRLNADLVVNRSAQALFASEVSLCCMYRSVSEQELNLFQLAARRVA